MVLAGGNHHRTWNDKLFFADLVRVSTFLVVHQESIAVAGEVTVLAYMRFLAMHILDVWPFVLAINRNPANGTGNLI